MGPDADTYKRYHQWLDAWVSELDEYLVVDFVLVNTGRAPADDVEVTRLTRLRHKSIMHQKEFLCHLEEC